MAMASIVVSKGRKSKGTKNNTNHSTKQGRTMSLQSLTSSSWLNNNNIILRLCLACYCSLVGLRLGWKVVSVSFLQTSSHQKTASAAIRNSNHNIQRRRLQQSERDIPKPKKDRILYIVTTLAEFDSGKRSTQKGYDRFSNTIVPVIRESVASMLACSYSVDVYLIAHYTVSPQRHQQLLDALPFEVGLEIWNSATPTAYVLETSKEVLRNHTRGLARQHRYVIKDKFFHYDLFVNFEDDMLIRGPHVRHYQNITQQLFALRQTAPWTLPVNVSSAQAAAQLFYGPMTRFQLHRTFPGFMRVEVALPDYETSIQGNNRFEQIPVDYEWSMDHHHHRMANDQEIINASICCHVSPESSNPLLPQTPSSDKLYLWETSLEALGVRHMPSPSLGWVILLGGNNFVEGWGNLAYVVGDYWSGRGEPHYLGKHAKRPDRKLGRFNSNQGGWMATRRQVAEWHAHLCPGSFLPPYDPDKYRFDGLDMRSVEYWSGGIQLSGIQSCNMQRIVTLDPDGFSRQLLYHTSNNKQRSKNVQHRFTGRNINEFWGQLNTIRKNAEKEMLREEQAQQ